MLAWPAKPSLIDAAKKLIIPIFFAAAIAMPVHLLGV